MTTQFTDEEIETIKELICDWGSDCPCTDYEKVQELKYKLGLEKRPTPEELAEQERKRKEFSDSDMGKQLNAIFKSANDHMEKFAFEVMKPVNIFYSGEQWTKDQILKINAPEDYNIKE